MYRYLPDKTLVAWANTIAGGPVDASVELRGCGDLAGPAVTV